MSNTTNNWPITAYSDTTGQLLMYVASISTSQAGIFGSDHQLLVGDPDQLNSLHNGVGQQVLFLPRPGDPHGVFVIVIDRPGFSAYPIRAGILAVALGASGQQPIVVDAGYTWFMEDLCLKRAGVPHANGVDYWFIAQQRGTDLFHSFRVGNQGITDPPVVSQAGTQIADPFEWGKLVTSHSGEWFVSVSESLPLNSVTELFQFNRQTGAIGHLLAFTGLGRAQGVEFSPNDRYLYILEQTGMGGATPYYQKLLQYDLSAEDILGSRMLVDSIVAGPADGRANQKLALGPDGRIYMLPISTLPYVGLILDPDMAAPACGFQEQAMTFEHPLFRDLPSYPKSYHVAQETKPNAIGGIGYQPPAQVIPNPLMGTGELVQPGLKGPVRVEWQDMQGRVLQSKGASAQNGRLGLDATGLAAGHYLVHVVPLNGPMPVTVRVSVLH